MKIVIKEPNPYYSYLDEEHFFKWLESIPAVIEVNGTSKGLEVVLEDNIDKQNFRDIIAIFKRYKIDMKPLKTLAIVEHEQWLNNKDAYWYEDMFGKTGSV